MVASLRMPHAYPCPHPTCPHPNTCRGNHVRFLHKGTDHEVITFVFPHHKAATAQTGVASGPVCAVAPTGSLTHRLTSMLIDFGLPHLYSLMADAPEAQPMPMLPDIWKKGGLDDGTAELRFSAFFSSNPSSSTHYASKWKQVCLGIKSALPQPSPHPVFQLREMRLVSHPFQPGPFNPSDSRRHFVTALVEHQGYVSDALGSKGGSDPQFQSLSDLFKRIAARNIGNRPETWQDAYDLLVRINERKLVEAIMQALKAKLSTVVQASKLLSKKRRRQQPQQHPQQRDANDDEAGPSGTAPVPPRAGWFTSLPGWFQGKGKGRSS